MDQDPSKHPYIGVVQFELSARIRCIRIVFLISILYGTDTVVEQKCRLLLDFLPTNFVKISEILIQIQF